VTYGRPAYRIAENREFQVVDTHRQARTRTLDGVSRSFRSAPPTRESRTFKPRPDPFGRINARSSGFRSSEIDPILSSVRKIMSCMNGASMDPETEKPGADHD